MGNALKVIGNNNSYNEYNNINKIDVVKVQKMLKSSPEYELPNQMFQKSIECNLLGKPIIKELCNVVNGWMKFNGPNKEFMHKFDNELKFINLIKTNEDFLQAYIIEEEKNNIWILIKESTFKYNKKYLECKNEFQRQNSDVDFNITIFDEDELEDLEEELSYKENYKRI